MTKPIFLKYAFLASFLLSLVVPILKVLHIHSNEFTLVAFVLFTIIFVVIGIYEVYSSNRLSNIEKVMWTVGFIILSTLTAFLYLLVGRSRIHHKYKILNR